MINIIKSILGFRIVRGYNELEETNGMLTHDDAQQKGDRIIMAKSAKELKSMTLKEFEKAAEQFDNDDPSVYNMCRKDYPDILAELEKEERI